jgi:ferredoxin-NADP reductase
MTVAEIDALLYLAEHPPSQQLERALRMPALSPGWQTSFRALLEQAATGVPGGGNAGLAPASGPPPAWPGFRPLRVARLRRESVSVRSLVLVPADAQPLVPAQPGQWVVLRLRPDPAAPPLLRNYSLSDVPASDHYRVSVKRETGGAASAYLHEQVHADDALDVSAPRGAFTLEPGDRPVVLLSGGVGATPVLAMLHALAAEHSRREVWWLFAARSRDEHPFAEEAARLLQILPHSHRHIRYSRPGPHDRPGTDFDAPGHFSRATFEEIGLPRDVDCYVCGPAGFLHDLPAALLAWGVSPTRVHTEVFGPAGTITPGVAAREQRAPHPPDSQPGTGPQIAFARSGLSVPWDPTYHSLLEFAEACDVPVRWSCRTGVCHTCESGLITGAVAYDPEPLEAAADGNLLICCSHPEGEVVLDL